MPSERNVAQTRERNRTAALDALHALGQDGRGDPHEAGAEALLALDTRRRAHWRRRRRLRAAAPAVVIALLALIVAVPLALTVSTATASLLLILVPCVLGALAGIFRDELFHLRRRRPGD